jgi:hypothetical protein
MMQRRPVPSIVPTCTAVAGSSVLPSRMRAGTLPLDSRPERVLTAQVQNAPPGAAITLELARRHRTLCRP